MVSGSKIAITKWATAHPFHGGGDTNHDNGKQFEEQVRIVRENHDEPSKVWNK